MPKGERPRVVSIVAHSGGEADGVRDHAYQLIKHLETAGWDAELSVIDWRSLGWRRAWQDARNALVPPLDRVLIHYSHLAWSRRGLAFNFAVLTCLCRRRAPVVLWIHDPSRVPGSAAKNRLASASKRLAMRLALWIAGSAIVPIEPTKVYWLSRRARRRVRFAASPSNIGSSSNAPPQDLFTVSCFAVLGGPRSHDRMALDAVVQQLVQAIGAVRIQLLGGGLDNDGLRSDVGESRRAS